MFETIADLRRCLLAIQGDADAVIVRAKNRYAEGYGADESAGYRCGAHLTRPFFSEKSERGYWCGPVLHSFVCASAAKFSHSHPATQYFRPPFPPCQSLRWAGGAFPAAPPGGGRGPRATAGTLRTDPTCR